MAADPRARRWPLAIAIGLFIMIAVNVVFMVVAISGADEIAPSYNEEAR